VATAHTSLACSVLLRDLLCAMMAQSTCPKHILRGLKLQINSDVWYSYCYCSLRYTTRPPLPPPSLSSSSSSLSSESSDESGERSCSIAHSTALSATLAARFFVAGGFLVRVICFVLVVDIVDVIVIVVEVVGRFRRLSAGRRAFVARL
jgi:hypothetical protein